MFMQCQELRRPPISVFRPGKNGTDGGSVGARTIAINFDIFLRCQRTDTGAFAHAQKTCRQATPSQRAWSKRIFSVRECAVGWA